MFPFLNGHREISIVQIQLLIRAPSHAEVGEHIHAQYQHSKTHTSGLHYQSGYKEAAANQAVEFDCVLARKYPGLYHGVLDSKFNVPRMSIGYQKDREFGAFVFSHDDCERGDIEEAYMLVKYEYSDSVTKGAGEAGSKEWIVRKLKEGNENRRKRNLGLELWNERIGGLDGEEVEANIDL